MPWSKVAFFWDGHPTFDRNPYHGYINPYYWVDDHPLLYGNNGSLDPGTYMLTVCHGQQLLQPSPTAHRIVEAVNSKETLLNESQKTNWEISELYISITGRKLVNG